jgi:hypothetical protein
MVDAFKPSRVIEPVDVAQVVGLTVLLPLMFGVGFTATTVVPALEVQEPSVAVTEYVPAAAVVAVAIDGF